MPIIFKNIRRKLAAQNKATAYMRYAIGEILLVVIGILIALQVNNWNENRKNRITELSYVKSLINDLQADSVNLKFCISYNKNKILGLDTLLTLRNKNLHIPTNNDHLYLLFFKSLSNLNEFKNNNTTLAQISNSDALGFFRKPVADSIASFQQSLVSVKNQTDTYDKIAYNTLYKGLAFFDVTSIGDTSYFHYGKWTGKHFPPVSKGAQRRKVFFNYAGIMQAITRNYVFGFLKPQLKRTEHFISYLRKTYGIK